ncbi:MAG: hypothetical protein WCG93_12375 [Paludibacter sp.]
MNTTIINKYGKLAGWNSITVNMLGRDVEGIKEVEYSDSTEKENAFGAGNMPIGRGEGNYTAKASITLFVEEEMALQQSLPPGKRFSDVAPFDVAVEYEFNGFKYTDRVRNAEFTGRSVAIKQGDKTIANKHELIVSHVDWNVK